MDGFYGWVVAMVDTLVFGLSEVDGFTIAIAKVINLWPSTNRQIFMVWETVFCPIDGTDLGIWHQKLWVSPSGMPTIKG